MRIEGIPDGWELVAFRRAMPEDYFLNICGVPELWMLSVPSHCVYGIIRKIEKPKQYRPFAKPEEAEPLFGETLRLKADHKSKFLFIGITPIAFQIGHEVYSAKRAFDLYERLDNTPFGVEVTE